MFVLLPAAGQRADVITSMRERGVNPTFHYVPLHLRPALRSSPIVTRNVRSPTTSAPACSGFLLQRPTRRPGTGRVCIVTR